MSVKCAASTAMCSAAGGHAQVSDVALTGPWVLDWRQRAEPYDPMQSISYLQRCLGCCGACRRRRAWAPSPHSPAAPHHREVAMSELDDFLTPTLTRQLEPNKR